MVIMQTSLFGGKERTQILVALRLLSESYPRELARVLDSPISGVVKALKRLEREGLVAARSLGRTRAFRLNPRYFAYDELRSLLDRLSEPESKLRTRVESLRRRPRRAGKRL